MTTPTLTERMSLLQEINSRRILLLSLQHDYLQKSGWKQVMDVPGAQSRFMWQKVLPNGRIVLFDNLETAMTVQASLDQCPQSAVEPADDSAFMQSL